MRRILSGENPLEIIFKVPESETDTSTNSIWVTPKTPLPVPNVTAYRLKFNLIEAISTTIHVSADERYELWVDGQRVGRGPERGTQAAWFFETYDFDFAAGEHIFVARVWQIGDLAPTAQVSVALGFLLVAESPHRDLLSTGYAGWEVKPLLGYSFANYRPAIFMPAGSKQEVDGALYPWGIENGEGEGWEVAAKRPESDHGFYGGIGDRLPRPATLPPQISDVFSTGKIRFASRKIENIHQEIIPVPANASEPELVRDWQQLLGETATVSVPAHTRQQIIIDLEEYYCAYSRLTCSGGQGSSVTLGWGEALYLDAEARTKGQRDEVEGCYFLAQLGDTVKPDGENHRLFESLWWRAGRYIQVLVETADEPLIIESLRLEETRYPLEMESQFSSDDKRLEQAVGVMLRGLQMCSHETYMDCPYYEQLMYVGDTRLEVLTTLAITEDDRLPRKALTMFNISRFSGGWGNVRSCFPSRDVQYIPAFALWWVGMVHDFALWRNDPAFIKSFIPGERATINYFLALINEDGLLGVPPGWNFEDWAIDWQLGNPPTAVVAPNGVLNWHFIYTLTLAAKLEDAFGEPEPASLYRKHRERLTEHVTKAFWDEEKALFADDLAHQRYSEHTQCLAILSGVLDEARIKRIGEGLLSNPNLTRTTIYFSHYLFETFRLLGQETAFFERLKLWLDLPGQGFKTTPEQPEPTRSDCHAWGAHPIFHYFATILGIRPQSYGFNQVEITPFLGPLQEVSGSMVHPQGRIEANLRHENGKLSGSIHLPEGVSGSLRHGGITLDLVAGLNELP